MSQLGQVARRTAGETGDVRRRASGSSVVRTDAPDKVTGAAIYAMDLEPGRLLHAKLVTSQVPHATIDGIDPSAAEALDGVATVLTAEDVPGTRRGQRILDQPILATGKVRYVGEPIAVVAAETEALAAEAASLVEVEYEPLDATFDLDAARRQEPPAVVHENVREYEFVAPDRDHHHLTGADADRPNLVYRDTHHAGDVRRGFEEADVVVEGEYVTKPFQHCALEPHVSIARVDQDGRSTIWTSTQVPHVIEAELCSLYPDLAPRDLTIRTPFVGGGFGGKVTAFLDAIVLAVARETSPRPVRLQLTRAEEFTTGVSRPEAIVRLTDGVTASGDLIARDAEITFDAGAYNEYLFRLTIAVPPAIAGVYDVPNLRWSCSEVYTNRPRTIAFRGFGKPQLYWAIERQMDRIAREIGMDPRAFRLRNLLEPGQMTALGERVGPHEAEACIDWSVERLEELDLQATFPEYQGEDWAVGSGFAFGMKQIPRSVSTVTIRVQRDMAIEVRVGAPDIGQGSNTMLSQLAADAFGVEPADVTVVAGDTDKTAYDRGPTGSRFTHHAGNALIRAAEDAKQKLFGLASHSFDERKEPEDLATEDGRVFVRGRPDESIDVNELFTSFDHPGSTSRTTLQRGGELIGTATYDSGEGHACWTPVAQSAVVAVNTLTGQVEVLRMHTAADVGSAVNPAMVEQQLEGGTGQAIASALYEEIVYDNGHVVNPNFKDYWIPGATELPYESTVEVIESASDDGSFGAKGVGEAGMMAGAPAIGNAVANATGADPRTIPMTPERVLGLLTPEEE